MCDCVCVCVRTKQYCFGKWFISFIWSKAITIRFQFHTHARTHTLNGETYSNHSHNNVINDNNELILTAWKYLFMHNWYDFAWLRLHRAFKYTVRLSFGTKKKIIVNRMTLRRLFCTDWLNMLQMRSMATDSNTHRHTHTCNTNGERNAFVPYADWAHCALVWTVDRKCEYKNQLKMRRFHSIMHSAQCTYTEKIYNLIDDFVDCTVSLWKIAFNWKCDRWIKNLISFLLVVAAINCI